MKKTLCTVLSLLLVFTLLYGCGIFKPASTGRAVVSGSSCLIVLNGSPTVMINSSDDEDLFSDVRTGDLIKIKHANEIMESYPPQVNVYSCKIVSKGTADDVDKEVLDELASHGWDYE